MILNIGNWSALVRGRGVLARRGRPLLILLVVSLFCWLSVGIFYKLMLSMLVMPDIKLSRQKEWTNTTSGDGATSPAWRAITERNLFGSTEVVIPAEAPPPQTAKIPAAVEAPPPPPPTALLELKGTVAGDDTTAFAAIMERGKPRDALYKVGDIIAGATIKSIGRQTVELEAGDKIYTLKMAAAPLAPLPQAPGRDTAAFRPAGPSASPSAPPAASGPSGETRVSISRAEVASQLSDMGGLLTQAQIRPFFRGGSPDGFLISQIRPGSIYERMTIREGDIIQEVNNRRLRGADDMIEFYNLLKGAPTISLKILRDGRLETINYEMR